MGIQDIIRILGDTDSLKENRDLNFSSGGGYIQHSPELVEQLAVAICKNAKLWIKGFDQHFDHRPVNRRGIIGRIFGDYSSNDQNINYLNSIWYRLMCIDESGKEWGQPYFAVNPDKGKNICLNKYLRDDKLNIILNKCD
jgi:hypothetical protein